MPRFTQIRYYLEMLSVPVFAVLVVHLAGHGLMLLTEGEHEEHGHEGVESLFGPEMILGIAGLIIFVWIWHLPKMKSLVPCSHDHCHHKNIWPHLAATGAFVFHFFPESEVRHQLLQNMDGVTWISVAGVIGFASHFLVDLIVGILLAGYWPKNWQRVLAFSIMVIFWFGAFAIGAKGGLHLDGLAEPISLLISAFLLTMFVHKPHRPAPVCTNC